MLPDGHATFDLRFKISVWISLRSEYWKLNIPFIMVSFILRMLGCFENFFIIFSIGSLILLKSVRRIPNEVTAFSKKCIQGICHFNFTDTQTHRHTDTHTHTHTHTHTQFECCYEHLYYFLGLQRHFTEIYQNQMKLFRNI